MKCLVTGGCGFIGSHLVEQMEIKGHEVVVIDSLTSGRPENEFKGVRYYQVDFRDFEKVLRIFREETPDIVFHLGAVSRTPWAINEPLCAYSTNIVGSANILEASLQTKVKKVVLASSNIVYAAQTPYKTSKVAMEQVARDYNDLYGLPTICLRFSNVYGERQHPDNVLAALSKSKKEKGYILIHGDGEQTRNFTHVLDVCEALYRAAGFMLTSDLAGEGWSWVGQFSNRIRGMEIDVMNPKVWSLNEVAKYFDCEVKYDGERTGDIKHLKMGIGPEKAKELLGFEAKRDLLEYLHIYTNV